MYATVYLGGIFLQYTEFKGQSYTSMACVFRLVMKAVKDNKSPGVDGILPKLLMETVQQISVPLASVQLVIKRGSGSF